jgi:hypothetical protein
MVTVGPVSDETPSTVMRQRYLPARRLVGNAKSRVSVEVETFSVLVSCADAGCVRSPTAVRLSATCRPGRTAGKTCARRVAPLLTVPTSIRSGCMVSVWGADPGIGIGRSPGGVPRDGFRREIAARLRADAGVAANAWLSLNHRSRISSPACLSIGSSSQANVACSWRMTAGGSLMLLLGCLGLRSGFNRSHGAAGPRARRLVWCRVVALRRRAAFRRVRGARGWGFEVGCGPAFGRGGRGFGFGRRAGGGGRGRVGFWRRRWRAGGLAGGSHGAGWGSVPVAARGPVSAGLGAVQRGYRVRRMRGWLGIVLGGGLW